MLVCFNKESQTTQADPCKGAQETLGVNNECGVSGEERKLWLHLFMHVCVCARERGGLLEMQDTDSQCQLQQRRLTQSQWDYQGHKQGPQTKRPVVPLLSVRCCLHELLRKA